MLTARALSRTVSRSAALLSHSKPANASTKLCISSKARLSSYRSPRNLALALYKPGTSALVRYASSSSNPPGVEDIDAKREEKIGQKVMRAHPERVSSESTTHPPFHEIVDNNAEKEVDMMAGIRHDLSTIKDTFSLDGVPKEAFYVGMAGVLPYLATSMSTIYVAWDLNHAAHAGTGVLFDAHTAQLALAVLEPLQIGYGAVIISFLGAIHWGLEWAGYGGYKGYRRYAIGVVAPAVAWPTILMPVEYALISQFLAFNFLYFQDARAARQGTAPPWYGTYRFLLTFIVGASIVITLISRGQIVEYVGHPARPSDKLQELRESQMAYLQLEEKEKQERMASGEEEEEEDEGGDDAEGGEDGEDEE